MDKNVILRDFNISIQENHTMCFYDNYALKNLIENPHAIKFPKITCIDLMLTIVPCSFRSTCVIETSLSDFRLITLTVMRKEDRKFQPRIISYT